MATVRVRDWTKRRIEEIQEEESHSSHDSVIKSLIKDRELAQFAGVPPEHARESAEDAPVVPEETAVEGMRVFAEMGSPQNGVLFLWCPSCENEIAHLTVESPAAIDIFEVECQRCLTQLDQHALVAIELRYPLEERLVDGTLLEDLRRCVIDYWDRALAQVGTGTADEGEDDYLVRQVDRYNRDFEWDWPTDVPAVGVVPAETYRHTGTDERIEILEYVSENRTGPVSVRVRRAPAGEPLETADVEVLDAEEIRKLVVSRTLTVER